MGDSNGQDHDLQQNAMDESSSWSHLGGNNGDGDFTDFLNMGEFSLDFPAFDGQDGPAQAPTSVPDATTSDAMDFTLGISRIDDIAGGKGGGGGRGVADGVSVEDIMMQMDSNEEVRHNQAAEQSRNAMDARLQAQLFHDLGGAIQSQGGSGYQNQRAQQPHQHHQQLSHSTIPPTPNSMELQGAAARFYSQLDSTQQAALVDRYQRRKDDQMVFTPLVSPAVVPADAQYGIPEYAVPGAYMSPLTSPALEAQNAGSAYRIPYTVDGGMPYSSATSQPRTEADTQTAGPVRKQRRKLSNTPVVPSRVVRQSPSIKPQQHRRKAQSTSSSSVNLARDKTNALETLAASMSQEALQSTPHAICPQTDGSEADSVSPESLSEPVMGPPPAPRSIRAENVPTSTPEDQQQEQQSGSMHPATPSSLMRLQKSAEGAGSVQAPTSAGMTISPMIAPQTGTTQTTPTLLPKGSSNKGTNGASISPALGGMSGSPTSASTPKQSSSKANGTSNSKGGSKKRNNNASVQASPAIRPRISPSIKPLLPDGATVSAEASALILASKSNYQNLIEGNRLPGVSYPETLSTNLTSKRTSHKIAEQGRRNRINTALQEMASLLPSPKIAAANGNGSESNLDSSEPPTPTTPAMTANNKKGQGQGQTAAQLQAQQQQQLSNSKASTVEMAIEYIKELQQELNVTRDKLVAAESKLGGTDLNSAK